ncbi:MAG: TIGR02285 family protein [Mitsuaria chitosanitabida]|uniref:TIGR02285 family protein n=1 Tax=Roseateles chitosanitabidus TaxID=65048 RepID=UPI001B21C07B|nr:TIGR02285 family protein [Roseateles chitosanitabidus]MBO9688951.1 TIGR02285 family protein [Roseateles chitosanitabidus]
MLTAVIRPSPTRVRRFNIPRPVLATLALSLVAAAPCARAQPAEPAVTKITWLASDHTPVMTGSDASGVTNRVVTYLGKQWPQVQHEIVFANAKRSWQMIENGDEVCRANMVRTPEREKSAYFINTQLTPPPQLVVRRDRLAKLPRNAAGEVQLQRLFSDTRLRGALIDGRSYGPALDEVLAARPANGAVSMYSPKDFGARILQMISLGRADYSIEQDMALVMAGNPKDLASVPIQGASELVMAGIACPRTPWGLAAIRGIDRAYGRPEGAANLREGLMHWLTPETKAHYAARFDAFYRERAKPSRIDP